jgi:ubiquinone/menaquinone biosynthesis C-methylase UbiE
MLHRFFPHLSLFSCLALGDFGDPKYWNDAYATGKAPKEWYKASLGQVLSEIKDLLGSSERLSQSNTQVLHVGCGMSRWSMELADLGWNVTNIDSSTAAIQNMKERAIEHTRLRFSVMDVTSLLLPDDSFDVVLDKGTLHALGSGIASRSSMHKMVKESARILRAGGLFLTVSGSVTGTNQAQDTIKEHPNLRWLGERVIEQQADLARLEKFYDGKVPAFLKKPSYVHIAVAETSLSQAEL